MDSKEFNKYLKNNAYSKKFEKIKKLINSEDGLKFIDFLFSRFSDHDSVKDGEDLEKRILEKIHNKIKVEELISEISAEHRRQERILDKKDKNRVPIRRKDWRNKTRGFLIAGPFILILVLGIYLSNASKFIFKEEISKPISQIKKTTGKGQKLTLHLSDGSKIVLNSNSSIKYPETFNDSIREVFVEGEAFFEVTHNKNKPFMVHSGDLTSKVLGTSFNIRFHPEDHINVVALVTGKVQVNLENEEADKRESYVLSPGELMELNTLQGTFQKQKFDIEKEIAWKDNILLFTDANYKEVFETLENWYGVDIKLVNQSKKTTWELTAKFENENLENILNALSLSQGIQYEMNDKSVTIRFPNI